jgi:cyclophilin family peptidyl-prolyl cis-trans isomerase
VFGEVVKGQDVIPKIQKYGTREGYITENVIISDCGQLLDSLNT